MLNKSTNEKRKVLMISVTRLGDILSVFSTNVLTKSAQIVSDFLGYLEKDLLR